MATAATQNKWRRKNRLVKSQLNVMARKLTHEELDDFADAFRLRGKGLSPPGGGGSGDQHVKVSVLPPALLRRLHEKWISLTG